MYSVIFALFVTAVLLCTIVPAAAFRADAVVQATDPLIRWSGRAVPTSSGAVTWDWIGVQAVFTVSNATYVRAVISDSTLYGGRLSVWGQGVVTGSQRLPWADFATDVSGGGQQQYVLARGMGSDPVTLTLRSQLDPDYMGVGPGMNITLYSFSTDGQFTHTPYSATGTGRSMEVIGDSATTGSGARFYAPCHSSSVTNIYDGTYSDLLCSNIGAVCNVVATSSAGVLCSAGDTCDPQAQYTSNMPHSYDFGLAGCRNGGCPPGPASAWNFSSFIPDAVRSVYTCNPPVVCPVHAAGCVLNLPATLCRSLSTSAAMTSRALRVPVTRALSLRSSQP